MAILSYAGATFDVAPEETVLDALLRNGAGVSYSCRSGVCQSCLLKAGAKPPAASQAGLKETLALQNYFLACLCKPEDDMTLAPAEGASVAAVIEALEHLSPTVLQVRIRPAEEFDYRAGQYITLVRQDGLSRSYSVANLDGDGFLELHVRRTENGRMSGWLFDQCRPGEEVSLRGPAGSCFYVPGQPDKPLLLAGTGTGLAPLLGIVRDALRHGHSGTIQLFHGALRPEGLYLRETLTDLSCAYPNFQYIPVVREGGVDGLPAGSLDQVMLSGQRTLKGWRAFVCGDPAIVNLLRKKIFLAGAASKEIYADAFLPTCN